jgi:hypothetical protein
VEQVGCALWVPADQRVHEALGSPARSAGTAEKQEAADGSDGDSGAADAQHLPAAQPCDHIVVAGLPVLPLLWLAVLLGLTPLWRRLPALVRCLTLCPPLAGLSLPGLAALGLALPGLSLPGLASLWLSTLRLALPRLPLPGLAALWLPVLCSALLWLSATRLPSLGLALPRLPLSRLAALWLPALLWLAATLVTTFRVAVLPVPTVPVVLAPLVSREAVAE